MTRYDAQNLETQFKMVAGVRISGTVANDAGYWTGGRCNWGGSHNLREDCQVLANFFNKISQLKETKKTLTKFENQEEFETKKQDLSRQCQQAITGLQVKTGSATSIGGVCCIWGDYTEHLNSLLETFRRELESLKGEIDRVPYDTMKKLKKLQTEEKNLKRAIEENLKKAAMEKDPEKKRKLLILVEEDKKKLQTNLQEQAKIRIGENFDPDNLIERFLKGVEDKLKDKNRNRGGGSGGSGNPRNPNNPLDPNKPDDNNGRGGGDPPPNNPWQPNQSNQNSGQLDQQTLILIVGAVLVIMFLMMNQKEKPRREYDEYYY